MLHTFMTTQPFKLHFTDTEQYFLRPPGLLSGTFMVRHLFQIHTSPSQTCCYLSTDSRPTTVAVRSAMDVFVLVDCHSEADVDIWTATMASTSSHLDEKVAVLHYRHGPGRVRVSLFFYLFFHSFVDYVHIDTSTYLKAPGPSCGAEGRWRNVALTGSASV